MCVWTHHLRISFGPARLTSALISAVPVEYVPEYFWQIMMMHNEIPYSTHEFPDEPIRRLEAYRKDVRAVYWDRMVGLFRSRE